MRSNIHRLSEDKLLFGVLFAVVANGLHGAAFVQLGALRIEVRDVGSFAFLAASL